MFVDYLQFKKEMCYIYVYLSMLFNNLFGLVIFIMSFSAEDI